MYLSRLKSQRDAFVPVIVPVYNTEKYIATCIESLLSQTLKEIEIIIVDDGSPDMSIKIAESYWRDDPRIQIIHRDNGGMAAARNAGLFHEHAPYVMFCDSDDFYDGAMCETMYDLASKNNVDIAACVVNVIYHTNYNMAHSDMAYYNAHRLDGVYKVDDELILETDASVCDKIFSRRLINKYDLHFLEWTKV